MRWMGLSAGYMPDERRTGFMSCEVLVTFKSRLRGLLPGSRVRENSYVVFAPCRDIHTFGMDVPIDVAFADSQGRVVVSRRGVSPGKRVRCAAAVIALERLQSDAAWFSVGDNIFLDIERKGSR